MAYVADWKKPFYLQKAPSHLRNFWELKKKIKNSYEIAASFIAQFFNKTIRKIKRKKKRIAN